MKITGIKTFLAGFGQRNRNLIKVETDEGPVGWGEAYSVGPDRSVEPIVDYIFEMVRGEDPRRIEAIMLKLTQQFRFPPGGMGLAALSALDLALWDIAGKAANQPVYQLLGGPVRERVRVYRSIGGRSAEEAAEAAHRLNESGGFTAFKTGPYRLDPNGDRWGRLCRSAADYFRGLRDNTPDNWDIAFDPHAKIFEPIKALQLSQALAPFDPLFYEEPLRPEHIPAWQELRAQMQVPLATGECLYTRFEFLDLMAAQAVDIIQPDICVCGGLLEMRKIAAIAEAHHISVAPHNPMGPVATAANVQFAAATPNFKILEYVNPLSSEWKDWVDEPYLPDDGYLKIRNRPGLGVEVDEGALVGHTYTHWQRTSPILPDGSTGYI